jgi:segregation and condensation protein B
MKDTLAKKFGAATFVENFDQEGEDETEVLSLDALRNAFAGIEEQTTERAEISSDVDDEEEEDDDETSSAVNTDHPPITASPKSILEAMLFVGNRDNKPVSAEQAAEKMRNVSPQEIDQAVDELNQTYTELDCPYTIHKENGAYRLVLRTEYHEIRSKFYGKIKETTLSQSAIDVLAIVAYRQPLTANDVDKLRKQPSIAVLNQLLKRGLLEKEEKPDGEHGKKKAVFYRTTQRFLEFFELGSLDELPLPENYEF